MTAGETSRVTHHISTHHVVRSEQENPFSKSLKSSLDQCQSSIDSVHQQTTVHFNRFSCEVTRPGRGKESNDCGRLFWRTGIFKRNHIHHSLHLLCIGKAFMERSQNHAGSHSI